MLLNLLIKPAGIIVENIVQDRIGHELFGTFTSLLSLATVLAMVSDLGLTHHSTQRAAAEEGFVQAYYPTLLPMRSGLSLLFLLLTVAVGVVLGYRGHTLWLLALTAGGLLLTQYAQFLRGAVQAYGHFNSDAVLSVLEKALLLVLILVLLPIGITLDRYVGVRTVAAAFSLVLIFGLVRRLFGRSHFRPRLDHARQLLLGSLPFAFIVLLYGLNERVDMIMLERMAAPREAGYYAGAYRWVDAVMMYVWTIMPLFFARFAKASQQPDELRQLLWFGQRVVTIPLLLVCAFVLFRGEVLFWQYVHSTPAELARMTLCLKLLFLNVLVQAFFALYATLLNSTFFVRTVSRWVGVSLGCNVVLNLWLLPRYGALAAALNTLLCALGLAVGYLWLVHRRSGVPVPWLLLGRLVLAFGLLCGGWYLLQQWGGLAWWAESAVAAVGFGGLLLLLQVVPLRELQSLKNQLLKSRS